LITYVPGDPARPFGEAELKEKFRRITAPVFGPSKADAMFTASLAAHDEPAAMLREIDRVASGC
jgi:hypothetical protein